MHNLATRRNHNPSDSLLWVVLIEMLYVIGIGKRHSFSCGEADTPRSAGGRPRTGACPPGGGGEFVEPFSVQYLS
jgi:hypothetical protein